MRSFLGVQWKDWCWSWNSNTLATWCEELTHWKRPWCWKGLRAGGEGDDRGWEAGWHHWVDGHEFGWTPGVGDGQGGLASCNSWGRKESDTTERVNWTNWTELKCSYVILKMKQHRYKRSPFLTFSNSIVFLLSFATWGNHYPSVLLNFYRTHLVLYIVNGTYVVLANIFSSPRIIGPLTKFSFSSLFFRFFC